MTPREKADRAKQMLEDPLFRGVLNDVRMGLLEQLELCPMGDVDTQHEIALSLQLWRRIPDQLRRYADELTVEKHKESQDSFIRQLRQKIRA